MGEVRPGRPPAWWTWARRVTLTVGGAVLLGGTVVLISLGLDHVDVQPVTCQVTSATPHRNGAGKVTGSSGVLVDTRECGRIEVTGGSDHSDLDAAARSFVVGKRYVFDMGLTSRTWGKYLNMIPTARSFHGL